MFRNESAETFNKCSKAYELGRADEREKVLNEVKETVKRMYPPLTADLMKALENHNKEQTWKN